MATEVGLKEETQQENERKGGGCEQDWTERAGGVKGEGKVEREVG